MHIIDLQRILVQIAAISYLRNAHKVERVSKEYKRAFKVTHIDPQTCVDIFKIRQDECSSAGEERHE